MNSNLQLTRFSVLILVFLVMVEGCDQPLVKQESNKQPPMESDTNADNSLVKRGEYLVNIGLCNDCHSPKVFTEQGPVPDETRLLSGHPADLTFEGFDPAWVLGGRVFMNEHFTAFAGPWGVSFSANLTPDASGIGSWTEENFKTAIREGKYKGLTHNRELLPPMPWAYYANMTDEDLQAVFAYLKSLKPVKNVVPNPQTFESL